MRTLSSILMASLLASAGPIAVQGQSVGDTSVVRSTLARDKPSVNGDIKFRLEGSVFVKEKQERYYRVQHAKGTGWVLDAEFMSEEEAEEYRAKQRAERRRRKRMERKRRQYREEMRSKGYTIVLVRQTFSKNSADGVSVGLGLVNISPSKTVKYLQVTWKLFNSVGDPTLGKNIDSSTTQTRLVGPLEPEGTGFTEFENVWYSSVGTCAEIRKIEVEHIDGSTFTYISDLEDIARQAESVRLEGDCSYEAQQERK